MPTSELTESQLKILQFAADGLTYRNIADELGWIEQSVKNQARFARIKLGADNMTQAVAMAIRRKIIQ